MSGNLVVRRSEDGIYGHSLMVQRASASREWLFYAADSKLMPATARKMRANMRFLGRWRPAPGSFLEGFGIE